MGITCKQATEYIVKREEGKLTFRQRYRLWRHLVICKLCKLFARQNDFLSSSIKNSGTQQTPLSEADKASIIKRMIKE